MTNIAYWPGQDNTCKEVEGCRGAGTPEHIRHCLAEMSTESLLNEVLKHCGNRLSPVMSCMCTKFAREIGRRAKYCEAERKSQNEQDLSILKKMPENET